MVANLSLQTEKVSVEALEWAKIHIKRFGDSDILPLPFEYEAVEVRWLPLRAFLENVDLATHEIRAFQHFLVPKAEGGWRVAMRLDPLDALLYTAVIYECAAAVEAKRIPRSKRVACAYRVDLQPDGRFFSEDTGWSAFFARSKQLCGFKKYAYVVTADIADFYGQISHHRVENALEHAGVSSNKAQCVERLLTNWAAKQSRGIPVGPQASVVLAEAVLNDVDEYLMFKGYTHTRYVDDFRIFCGNYRVANRALHDLAEYLYTAHRLALQSGKTFIYKTQTFLERRLEDPDFLERQKKSGKMSDLIAEVAGMTGYNVTIDDIPDDDRARLTREALKELLDECLSDRPLRLGLARHVFRSAAAIRTRVLHVKTLQHLEILAPVLRDACNYLMRTRSQSKGHEVVEALCNFARNSSFSFSPFVWEWVSHALLKRYPQDAPAAIKKLTRQARQMLGIRPEAEAARVYRMLGWVRQHKETWNAMGPWDRRAVIAAGAVLPSDERRHWLKLIQAAGDPLDQAVADFAMLGQ